MIRRKVATAAADALTIQTLPTVVHDDDNYNKETKGNTKTRNHFWIRKMVVRICLLLILLNVIIFTLTAFTSNINDSASSSSSGSSGNSISESTYNDSSKDDKDKVRSIFLEAGITLKSDELLDQLPSWRDVVREFGPGPKIYGLDQCESYRLPVPAVERNIGCCGMFNSGTNLVTKLLKSNCKIPERVEKYGWNHTMEKWGIGEGEAHGIRWQVPWGKHTHPRYREKHATDLAKDISKESLLPIVTIRHPYGWMKSMCSHAYTATWRHNATTCPHLVKNKKMDPVPLSVKYGGKHFTDNYTSLAHLWNGWYEGYWKNANYPFLMVRFEDLVFHTKDVVTQICHCAGGQIRSDRPFQYIVESAKEGPGHGDERTGMESAWIHYGKQPTGEQFSKLDQVAAVDFLNQDLMDLFGYRHNSSSLS